MDINTVQNVAIRNDLAGVGYRIISYFIDILVIMTGYAAIMILVAILGMRVGLIAMIFYGIVAAFYSLICEVLLNGQSIGKKIMKLRVVKTDNSKVTFLNYLMRWLFRLVDISITSGGCAVLCIASTEKSQRLGDILAKTTVIRINANTSLDNTMYMNLPENYTPTYPSNFHNLSDSDISIVRDVLNRRKKTFRESDNAIIKKTREAIEKKLGVESKDSDIRVLYNVLKDYNYYNMG